MRSVRSFIQLPLLIPVGFPPFFPAGIFFYTFTQLTTGSIHKSFSFFIFFSKKLFFICIFVFPDYLFLGMSFCPRIAHSYLNEKGFIIMLKNTLRIVILFIFSILAGIFFTPCHADDIMGEYVKKFDELRTAYTDAIQADMKRKADEKRAREQAKSKNTDYDDDDDRKAERQRQREERKKLAKERQKSSKESQETKKILEALLIKHGERAVALDNALQEAGISRNYEFSRYAEQLVKTYNERGLDSDYSEDIRKLQQSINPLVIFESIEYDLQLLAAAGIEITDKVTIPENYKNYQTFFEFYEDLEYYLRATGNLGTVKSSDDYSKKKELDRRFKRLKEHATSLNNLLLKNDREFASKMAVVKLVATLETHYKTLAFRKKTSVEDFLDKPGRSIGNSRLSPSSFLTKKTTKDKDQGKGARLDPYKKIQEELKLRIGVFQEVAADLRVATPDKNLKKKSSKRRSRGKASEDNQEEPKTFKSPYTVFFAEVVDPEAIKNAKAESKGNNPAESKEKSDDSTEEVADTNQEKTESQDSKDDKSKNVKTEDKTEDKTTVKNDDKTEDKTADKTENKTEEPVKKQENPSEQKPEVPQEKTEEDSGESDGTELNWE